MVRQYVVGVEIAGGIRSTPAFEVRLVEAFDLEEACKQVYIETFSRYRCDAASIVFIAPATPRAIACAQQFMLDLPLLRMFAIGQVS